MKKIPVRAGNRPCDWLVLQEEGVWSIRGVALYSDLVVMVNANEGKEEIEG